ncbi:hypothetical protein IPL85_06000 [Candidatus Saccharibacteria bacterium]|nr:MAG: hypothetical protein IPL85_06000 [Candidatus Saccharibacteria bacterium]
MNYVTADYRSLPYDKNVIREGMRMNTIFKQTFNLHPRSEAELQAVIRRFEDKWQRRRRAHRIAGLAL